MKTAIVFGSTTGKTRAVAGLISRLFPGSEVLEVGAIGASDLEPYDLVVLGTSTWGTGGLQEDWARRIVDFPPDCLRGKTLAFFGLGDCLVFPETFCSAVSILHDHFGPMGRVLGPPLFLDDDNQGPQTPGLVEEWVAKLKVGTSDNR